MTECRSTAEPLEESAKPRCEGRPVAAAETRIDGAAVAEAALHMDLAERPGLMFKNSARGGRTSVDRRTDGQIGRADPGASG
jgi:hypothetical protein